MRRLTPCCADKFCSDCWIWSRSVACWTLNASICALSIAVFTMDVCEIDPTTPPTLPSFIFEMGICCCCCGCCCSCDGPLDQDCIPDADKASALLRLTPILLWPDEFCACESEPCCFKTVSRLGNVMSVANALNKFVIRI